jgi:hypothetical protein
MKKLLLVALSALLCLCLNACATTESVDLPTPEKGRVSGKVTDGQGKPLSGVKITAEHTLWHATYVFGVTDNDGNYTIELPEIPAGMWTVSAKITKSAYDKEYLFDLDGDKTAFTQDETVVRDFTWKIKGARPNSDYFYGAHLDIYTLFGTDAPLDKIKIIFTPIEPLLIDGSPAVPIEGVVENIAGTFMVKDIPIGKYTVKAVYPDKTLLLKNKRIDDVEEINKFVVFDKYGYLADTEYNIEFWVSE